MGFGEYLSLAPAPPEARVGGRSVLLIPARAADLGPDALPADYQLLAEFFVPATLTVMVCVPAVRPETVNSGAPARRVVL